MSRVERRLDRARSSGRGTLFLVTVPFGISIILANVVGAVIVAVSVALLEPSVQGGNDTIVAARLTNGALLIGYLAIAVPVGVVWGVHMLAPVRRWLWRNEPPTESERDYALRAPLKLVIVPAVLWAIGGTVFTLFNLHYGGDLPLAVAVASVLGAAGSCAFCFLLGERIGRGVFKLALAAGAPARPPLPGVSARVLLTWALSTGLPVLGVVLIAGGDLLGIMPASSSRLARSALFLGVVGLLIGLVAMAITARSVADPVQSVRSALDRVRDGDTAVQVPVYDGSEVGLLQAGFNEMVAGLRERERLRDMFGRHVGEDVARQALEHGAGLGGEVREVAVLFVDVVGSTELAATTPAQDVVKLLNEFFAVVVRVVQAHRGSINKFEGDAALCVFGAPDVSRRPAADALAAARDLRAALARELPGVDCGIGVSAGSAVAGNIGTAERFEYTVIGDPVNEAARLTELAKSEDGRVLASQAVVDLAGSIESPRWAIGEGVALRGRGEQTRVARPT